MKGKEKELEALTDKYENGVRRIIEEEKSRQVDIVTLESIIRQRIANLQTELLASVKKDNEMRN